MSPPKTLKLWLTIGNFRYLITNCVGALMYETTCQGTVNKQTNNSKLEIFLNESFFTTNKISITITKNGMSAKNDRVKIPKAIKIEVSKNLFFNFSLL